MRGLVFRPRFWIAIALSGLLNCASYGQIAGHYVGGITGLENGTAPPPGFFGTFLPYVNHITSIKGPAGHTVLNSRLQSHCVQQCLCDDH